MKSGELKRVANSYGPFFPAPWVRIKNEFLRRSGPWVQIVSFNASRFDDTYVPRSACDYLYMPGEATGVLLGQELESRPKVQRWVSKREHDSGVGTIHVEMSRQFRPALGHALTEAAMTAELERRQEYWPHVYVLAVQAAERGDRGGVIRYLERFRAITNSKPFEWVKQRDTELEQYLALTGRPEGLMALLTQVASEKLKALGLT